MVSVAGLNLITWNSTHDSQTTFHTHSHFCQNLCLNVQVPCTRLMILLNSNNTKSENEHLVQKCMLMSSLDINMLSIAVSDDAML